MEKSKKENNFFIKKGFEITKEWIGVFPLFNTRKWEVGETVGHSYCFPNSLKTKN